MLGGSVQVSLDCPISVNESSCDENHEPKSYRAFQVAALLRFLGDTTRSDQSQDSRIFGLANGGLEGLAIH